MTDTLPSRRNVRDDPSLIFTVAADVIRKRGWWQGRSAGPELVGTGRPVGIVRAVAVARRSLGWPSLTNADYDTLADAVGADRLTGPDGEPLTVGDGTREWAYVSDWNDAPERTPADVLAALDAAGRGEVAPVYVGQQRRTKPVQDDWQRDQWRRWFQPAIASRRTVRRAMRG